MRWLVAIVLIVLGVAAAHSRGGFTTGGCPYPTQAVDGCGASPGGSFQQANAFGIGSPLSGGYFQASGQTYATRPAWNVAGVDYPIGPTPARWAALCPVNNLASANCNRVGNALPANCDTISYANVVYCKGGSGDLTFDGFDFTVGNGYRLEVDSPWTGPATITVKNSRFAGCCSSAVMNGGSGLIFGDATSSVLNWSITNNYVDGCGVSNAICTSINAVTPALVFIGNTPGTSIALNYNVIKNFPGNGYVVSPTGSNATIDVRFNWLENCGVTTGGPHAQCGYFGGNSLSTVTQAYNVFTQSPQGFGNTSMVSLALIPNSFTAATVKIENNTIVASANPAYYVKNGYVTNGGSGYVAGDVITVNATGCSPQFKLDALDISGGVVTTGWFGNTLLYPYTLNYGGGPCPAGTQTALNTTGGSGSGLKISITPATSSASSTSMYYDKTANITGSHSIQNNYFDLTGSSSANGCGFGGYGTEVAPTIAGNYDLVSGASRNNANCN